jgi:hypothetical protein
MTLIAYIEKRFGAVNLEIVEQANKIIAEYETEGLTLTLRQLFYQFVARGLAPNSERTYRKLSKVISDARLAGLVSWKAIEDRTRFLREQPNWGNPQEILDSCATQFRVDKWATQPCRVEVWIEKDALTGVIDQICKSLQVPYLSCRGYTSQSEQWRAGMRFAHYIEKGQEVHVLHLGDHDPSGIDMTRDNQDRVDMFTFQQGVTFNRLALNIDQVRKYNPPPNPTKPSDSRTGGYEAKFGKTCWELDALDPKLLSKLVKTNVLKLRDEAAWKKAEKVEQEHRDNLRAITDNYDSVIEHLNDL